MADFLAGYEGSAVKSVEDIVEFNTKHADLELPEGKSNLVPPSTRQNSNPSLITEFPNGQTQLTDALAEQMSDEQYDIQKAFIREKAGPQGLDKVFVEHEVDVIAGPLDGRIVTIAAAAGYPCGVVPLGYADNFNGRAYGMTVVAPAGGEDRIIKFMSAWEASNPNLRKPPPQLEDWNSQL
jgi:amidase